MSFSTTKNREFGSRLFRTLFHFDVGQPVIVNNVIASKHSGKRAVIVEYRPTRKGTDTLDKYVVEIGNGERLELWAIQLETGVQQSD